MNSKTFFYSFGVAFLLTSSGYAMDNSELFDSGICMDGHPGSVTPSQGPLSPQHLPSKEVGLDMTEEELNEAFSNTTYYLNVQPSTDLVTNNRLSEKPDSSKYNEIFLKLLRAHPSASALVRKLDLPFPSEEVLNVLPSLKNLHTLSLRNIDASRLQKTFSPTTFSGKAPLEKEELFSNSLFPSSLRELTLSFNSSVSSPLDFKSWSLREYEYFTITGGVTVVNLPALLEKVRVSQVLTINGNFQKSNVTDLTKIFKNVSYPYLVKNGRKTIFPEYTPQ